MCRGGEGTRCWEVWPLSSHKQTAQRPHLFRYLLRTYKSAALPLSPLRCYCYPAQRLPGLTWHSLPKGNCGWKSKEQTLHASAKNGNHGGASGSPVHGDLVSSQKQKSCEITSCPGNCKTERSVLFMDYTVVLWEAEGGWGATVSAH